MPQIKISIFEHLDVHSETAPTPTPAPTSRLKEILSICSKLHFMQESEKKLWDESDTVFAPKELRKPQENKTKS